MATPREERSHVGNQPRQCLELPALVLDLDNTLVSTLPKSEVGNLDPAAFMGERGKQELFKSFVPDVYIKLRPGVHIFFAINGLVLQIAHILHGARRLCSRRQVQARSEGPSVQG